MNIQKYPWLITPYKNILTNYENNKLHHAIIIQSHHIQNTFKLIWAISKWILCINKIGIKNCGICKGCILVKKKNHPDLYILYPKKNKKFLEIDIVRNTIYSILNTAQQYGKKILWIPKYHTLTISSINTLLKIIEEPPKNTFFFIGNYTLKNIHLTLRSRFFLYHILETKEKISLEWIQKNTDFKEKECLIALKISQNHPEIAKNLLKSKNWIERKKLYFQLNNSLQKNNFINLLPILNNQTIIKIQWIILLLLDVIKKKLNFSSFVINLDQEFLIQNILKKYSYKYLDKIIKSWIKCRYQLINIENINNELLIFQQLIKWQNIIHKI